MSAVGRAAVRRPRAFLLAWVAACTVLAVIGLGVESRLTQSVFILPGTETSRAYEIAADEFGENVIIPILLEGPPAALDRQGPELVRELEEHDDARVLSAWDQAAVADRLRLEPNAALIVATFDIRLEEAFDTLAPEVRGIVDGAVTPPVEASVTGMPIIGNDIKEETYSSAHRAELLAMPILAVVLLLVFRAPLAALIPAVTGLAALFASPGLISMLAGSLSIDPIATALASMMGLALGVDYALLMVSRFREELHAGLDPPEAARRTSASAGRTVLFAALALIVSMAVALLIAPGDLLLSAAVGVIVATVLSAIAAMIAMPAALTLIGTRIDLWSFGCREKGKRRGRGAMRRPGLVTLAVLIPLLALSMPALALDTGPPDVRQLPEDSRARTDFERVRDVAGPGWASPFEVMIVEESGPITEVSRLRTLRKFQRSVAERPDVATVIGPGRLSRQATQLARVERSLNRGTRQLDRLQEGLDEALAGAADADAGLAEAASAASSLAAGGTEAQSGAQRIAGGIGMAAAAAGSVDEAIADAEDGADRMVHGMERLRGGLARLMPALGLLQDRVEYQIAPATGLVVQSLGFTNSDLEELIERSATGSESVQQAWQELEAMTIGQADPRYAPAMDALRSAYGDLLGVDPVTGLPVEEGYDGLTTELGYIRTALDNTIGEAERVERALRRVADGVGDIKRGVARLRQGASQLLAGSEEARSEVERLRDGAVELAAGLTTLRRHTETLSEGLGTLAGSTGILAARLAQAGGEAGPMIDGLSRARSETGEMRDGGELERLTEASPGLFDSGYFVLAAIDGTEDGSAARAEQTVNVQAGGEAGRVVVVPETGPNDERTADLRRDLSAAASDLGGDLEAGVALGGTAAALVEYDDATGDRIPLLILALAAASYLVLIPVFRSILLPAIAVALNLLSVGVAFAALALLFQGSDPLLGGPGYVDAVALIALYTVIFGLSLDYQVFLITRMREGWIRHADTDRAVEYGLDRTASVVTGAAAIMAAVFFAFAVSDITNTRQFGVGLTIAVIVDATIVRLVLLPAVIRIFGDTAWAFPRPRGAPSGK